jgi:hypothetical protein
VFVAAVLGPEEREDRELEVVRLAFEQRADALVLPVREAECTMERLFRDAAQRKRQCNRLERRCRAASKTLAGSLSP